MNDRITPNSNILSAPSASSCSYRRTSESFSQAGLKASAALSTMGSAISRKLEDVKLVVSSLSPGPHMTHMTTPWFIIRHFLQSNQITHY